MLKNQIKLSGVLWFARGHGKNVRVAVFAQNEKVEEAKKAGADIVGLEDLASDINPVNWTLICLLLPRIRCAL